MILYDAIQAHAMDVQSATYGRDWFERIRREATAEWLAHTALNYRGEHDPVRLLTLLLAFSWVIRVAAWVDGGPARWLAYRHLLAVVKRAAKPGHVS